MSNSLDPDQDRRFVGPDLGINCLQRLSAVTTKVTASKERVKYETIFCLFDLILYVPSTNLSVIQGRVFLS